MKVLVAEDSKSNLWYLEACIQEAGYEVVTAINGLEALEKFDKNSPDLILLDVIMPEMDGITAAKEIRKRTISRDHWVPIVFISAMDNDMDIVKGLEAGGDDYIIKPVTQPVLNAKLHAMQRIYTMQNALDQANQKLRQLSERDALTGIANRRKFDEHIRREWKRSARTKLPLTLCMLDVDCFKPFNDNYGHSAGDKALSMIAECLARTVRRPGDLAARYGGEEFALILPETEFEGVKVLLERVRKAIEELNIKHEFSTASTKVTVSAGSMTILPARDFSPDYINRLIVRADQALYEAKKGGRNRTVSRTQFATPQLPPKGVKSSII